jgi:putative ABC transport system permease protein
MRTLWQDLQYACRLALKNRGFTTVAVMSLAIGIGANTVLFSIVYGVLLRPLPYDQPDRLMRLIRAADESDVTIPEFEFWKEHSKSFESVAAYRYEGDQDLSVGNRSERLSTVAVTADFFRTLGVRLPAGREFESEETRVGRPDAVILTHNLWQLAFAGDPAIVGRTITLDKTSRTVVGVLPADFWFPQPVDAFVPLRATGSATDSGTNTGMIGRLKPGMTVRQAAAETAMWREPFRRESRLPYPLDPGYQGLTPSPFQYWLTGDVRLILLVIFAAAGVLLLIACSNLASLILARLAGREREVAVRLALGSSRSRLVRQFLTENLVLSAAGGAAGFLLASWVLPGLLSWIPWRLPAASPIRLDLPAMTFTFAVVLIAGFLLSLAPCLSSSKLDIHERLKDGGHVAGNSPARRWTRTTLVVGQIAMSAVLLVSAMLLSESLYRLNHQELGFDPNGLTTFRLVVDSVNDGSGSPGVRSLEKTLLDRFRSLPGVQNAAGVNLLPFNGQNNFPTQRYGHPEQSFGGMEIRFVTPDYFETMGIPIRSGRGFNAADDAGAPPVIAVSESVARRWWPNGQPLGDMVVIGLFQGRPITTPDSPRTIVGVVANTKSVDIKERPRPTVYVPYAQAYAHPDPSWVIRGNLPKTFAEQLRAVATQIDPRFRVESLRTMDDTIVSITADSRFNTLLFGMFAGTAVLLASIGVFGLLSFSVAQRTREIGTRLALGASRGNVMRLILKEGAAMMGAGLLFGIGGALELTRFLSRLLFGIQANDAASYLAAAVLLLLVGILASYVPARRAMNIDPMTALRNE